jgi:TonB family protein
VLQLTTRLTAGLAKLGIRASAVGLSGAVHAAIFLTPLGHPGPARTASVEPALVDVEVESAPRIESKPIDAPLENRVTVAPTHRHPYPVPEDHDFTPHDPALVHVMHAAPMASSPSPSAPLREATADTSTVLAAASDMPHFTLAISNGSPGAGGVATTPLAGASTGHPDDDGDASAAIAEQAVDSPARLVRGETPSYPSDARAEGVEAKVKLELVVSAAGRVEDVRVVRRAGHGLDEAAVSAAREFRFTPAIKHGHAVRVRMSWAVEFRLD